MSLLANLNVADVSGDETDSLGGQKLLNSALYACTIDYAYVVTAESGAKALAISLTNDKDETHKEIIYFTNKAGEPYYVDKNDNTKKYLPGYNMLNSMSLLACGKELTALDFEEKVVKVWNKEAKAEVPTKVQMATDLLNKPIIAGILRQTVDKTVKDGNNVYQPTGETRDENQVDKFFHHEKKMTTSEIKGGSTEPAFYDAWKTKWEGVTKMKAKGAQGTAGAPKAGANSAAGTTKPKTSLFG